MKLFLSYSRDDKAWVYELWRALRDRAHHDAWIDQRIVPAQDWWETILEAIEAADCFVYVLTPRSVESIYCQAEVAYALALNKPIVPLILKPCEYPAALRRIQHETVTDQMSLGDVLFAVGQALSDIRVDLVQGVKKYQPPNPMPPRPSEPRPARRTDQAAEVYLLAAEAAKDGNEPLAEKLYQQVIEADPDGWGEAAQERLTELRQERERRADYERVKRLKAGGFLKDARAAWKVYVRKHGADYDPDGLAILAESAKPSPPTSGQGAATPAQSAPPLAKPSAPAVIKPPSVVELLPPPFEWIPIPAGRVTLITEKGWYKNYIPEGKSRTFDVPAFAIAKYPITNAQYAKFVEAGGYSQKTWWTDAGWQAREQGIAWNGSKWEPTGNPWIEPRYWRDSQWNGAECPVVGVSWYEVVAFCQWLSKATGEAVTLPTEQQWQRAAQGDDGRKYPWGNQEPDERRGNFDGKVGHTTPVTQYPAGASPYGVMDMSGNVWEWCLTAYETGRNDLDGTDVRVLRGGSWSHDPWLARAAFRSWLNPDSGAAPGGSGCARLPLPDPLDSGPLASGGEGVGGGFPLPPPFQRAGPSPGMHWLPASGLWPPTRAMLSLIAIDRESPCLTRRITSPVNS